MNFQISDELKEKIEMNVKYDIDLKNKLLSGDGNAIEWGNQRTPDGAFEGARYDAIPALHEKRRTKIHNRERGQLLLWFRQASHHSRALPGTGDRYQRFLPIAAVPRKQFRTVNALNRISLQGVFSFSSPPLSVLSMGQRHGV